MKKLFILSLLLLTFSLSSNTIYAAEYMFYQDVTFVHKGAKFLEDYPQSKYDQLYGYMGKRKFFGWKTYTGYKTEEVTYKKDTIYVIKNEGDTAITETFTYKYEQAVKKQYNVSGNIELSGSGTSEKIKGGLEQKLSNSITTVSTTSSTETFTIKVEVDPGTQLFVEILGEGKLSNGVAKRYCFWRVCKKGGWEVFLVTTEYYSLRKERLWKKQLCLVCCPH